MFKVVELFVLLFTALSILITAISATNKSCTSYCSESHLPLCGVWLNSENSRQASGIYVLGAGLVNLTCIVHSLPRPVDVKWFYKTQYESEPAEVKCTSMRIVIDCSHNAFGEHRVVSTCLIKVAELDQTADYHCRAVGTSNDDVVSKATEVQVYGISSLSHVNSSLPEQNAVGFHEVVVCGNPKPELTWINDASGVSLRDGASSNGYSALSLHRRLQHGNGDTPARLQRYCYTAQLLISRVQPSDVRYSVFASNAVTTKRLSFHAKTRGGMALKLRSRASGGLQLHFGAEKQGGVWRNRRFLPYFLLILTQFCVVRTLYERRMLHII